MININLDNIVKNKYNRKYIDNLDEIKNYSFNSIIKQREIDIKIKNELYKPNVIIDRFEEDIAVCEVLGTNTLVNIKKDKLPINIKEGNVLKFNNGRYVIDFNKSSKIKENIENIVKDLWEN